MESTSRPGASRSDGHDLLASLGAAHTLDEACGVLAAVLQSAGAEPASLLLRRRQGEWEVRCGLVDAGRALPEMELGRSPVWRALRSGEPALVEAPPNMGIDGGRCVTLPLVDGRREVIGGLLVEAEAVTGDLRRLGTALAHCGPLLGHMVAREEMAVRVRQLERENDLLKRVQEVHGDPVVITDSANNILVANRRAEDLFRERGGDSIGRSHAVRTNAFLFSAYLTQARMAGFDAAGHDLTLVDPNDGSDLLFEVLGTRVMAQQDGERIVVSVLRDITDLKRAVSELELEYRRSRGAEHRARHESQRLNAIIENAGEPILVTDGESRIVLMNTEAERLFDVPDGSGDRASRHPLWANVTRFTGLVNEFLLGPKPRNEQRLTLVDPDTGRDIPVQAVSTKILDRLDEPVAVVTVLRDLTQQLENERLARELRRLNDDLENRIEAATRELADRNRLLVWQSRELEQASRLKSEFLARMSHELRTPINAVIGYAALLRERIYGEVTPDQDHALERLQRASEHLLALISEILDLSKIEAGRMPVRVEAVEVEDLVRGIAQTIRPLADEKGLEVCLDLQPELPILYTDPTKLRQVLLNLVQNAVKYTHEGGVTVRAVLARAGGHLRLQVEDTGIGIKDEHLELVFEDFRQVDQSAARPYGGTGLGLAISRKLVALMGGTVTAESTFGEGSRFTVELPLRVEPGSVADQTRRAFLGSAAHAEAGSGDAAADPDDAAADPDDAAAEGNRASAEEAGATAAGTAGAARQSAPGPDGDSGG